MANNFVYLRNEVANNDGFKKQRGFRRTEHEEEEPRVIGSPSRTQLRRASAQFVAERRQRTEQRTVNEDLIIDFIRIDFFSFFNLDLQRKFLERYGLSVIEYTNYNKSVLFEITDQRLFQVFIDHVRQAYESRETQSYEGQPYNLIALIYNFEFLNDVRRIRTTDDRAVIISLMTSANRRANTQRTRLFDFLRERAQAWYYSEESPELIEVEEIANDAISTIARNFDIVRMVSSARALNLRPGAYGELRREFGFDVTVPENLPIVGVIDSGVEALAPIRPAITNIHYNHTSFATYSDEIGHGTMVAGLIILGEEFATVVKREYTAKARIAVVKAIHYDNDPINIPRLLNDIRHAKAVNNIRLFNMSLNLGIIKPYNDRFCDFAYELDRLAYEEDILIFMSVGNYSFADLQRVLGTRPQHQSHLYPRFFYDLNSTSADHSCWFTNIQEPAESMNNISVGALANNLEGDSDETPAAEYPAYYTRKFHFDHNQQVNGTTLGRNQANKHLNKPDLVFDGGDVFSFDSGMEVLRSPMNATERFYGRSCGTSLASPLIASYAAEVLNKYPTFRTQTIKALLINSAYSISGNNPPAFQGPDSKLLKKLIGFGRPSKNNLIETDDNTVVFVIEDSIELEELKAIPINVPEYVSRAKNKLRIEATLCFSFLPVKDNHLSYQPLHMSFGIFKPVAAETIANGNADDYYIKSGISWSEDFHGVENRLFSNAQKLSFNLQPNDLRNVNNVISLVIRCTGKKEIPEVSREHLTANAHNFSLVISISEIPEVNASGRLFAEMIAINEVENIVALEGEADIELENEV